jgi:NitT/TauT family transport system substrate-binding protein
VLTATHVSLNYLISFLIVKWEIVGFLNSNTASATLTETLQTWFTGMASKARGKKMGDSRKLRAIITLLLLIGLTLLRAEAAFAEKLRVAYTAFAGTFTILWVGHEAGLYRKNGVDLELLYIGSSTKAVQALLGGDIDIVYSAAGAVVDANLAGADLVMIGCQYDQGQTSFFTTASIASISALKGKTVGVSRFGSFSDFVARYVLRKNRLQPVKDVAILQVGGTQEIIAAMQKNLVQGGSISLPLSLNAKQLGFRELMTTETIGLPFDYGCFIVKRAQLRAKREELKKVLRATIAAYDLAIQEPQVAKKAVAKYTRTTDPEILDATYKENVKEYAQRIPWVSFKGLASIVDFRSEGAADVKKLALEKMYDNSLLQEIQKEVAPTK